MEDNLNKAKQILKQYHQEHLLHFYEEISEEDEVILPIKKPAKMEMMHIIITAR